MPDETKPGNAGKNGDASPKPQTVKSKQVKRKHELGPKQQRLIRTLATADSIAAAGRMAGYGTNQSTHRAMKSIRRNATDILDKIGYGQEKALQDLREMADYNLTKFFAEKGIVMTEKTVSDNETRLRARIELNKIHGHYPAGSDNGDSNDGGPGPGGIVINLGFLEPKRAEAILAKLTRHRADRSAASLQDGAIDVAPGE